MANRFMVQQIMASGWEPAPWYTETAEGRFMENTFLTVEAANAEIADVIAESEDAFNRGDMDSAYREAEFRVVPLTSEDAGMNPVLVFDDGATWGGLGTIQFLSGEEMASSESDGVLVNVEDARKIDVQDALDAWILDQTSPIKQHRPEESGSISLKDGCACALKVGDVTIFIHHDGNGGATVEAMRGLDTLGTLHAPGKPEEPANQPEIPAAGERVCVTASASANVTTSTDLIGDGQSTLAELMRNASGDCWWDYDGVQDGTIEITSTMDV